MRLYDYEVRRGETFDECFYITDDDDNPADLSGFNVKGQVRPFKDATTLTAEFHCSIDLTTACVRYMLRASETKELATGSYEYDVCLYEDVDDERIVKYYIGGKFTVLKSVTDALE